MKTRELFSIMERRGAVEVRNKKHSIWSLNGKTLALANSTEVSSGMLRKAAKFLGIDHHGKLRETRFS